MATQYVTDGGYELYDLGVVWTPDGLVMIATAGDRPAHSGTRYLYMAATGGGELLGIPVDPDPAHVLQVIDVVPGQTYELSLWAWAERFGTTDDTLVVWVAQGEQSWSIANFTAVLAVAANGYADYWNNRYWYGYGGYWGIPNWHEFSQALAWESFTAQKRVTALQDKLTVVVRAFKHVWHDASQYNIVHVDDVAMYDVEDLEVQARELQIRAAVATRIRDNLTTGNGYTYEYDNVVEGRQGFDRMGNQGLQVDVARVSKQTPPGGNTRTPFGYKEGQAVLVLIANAKHTDAATADDILWQLHHDAEGLLETSVLDSGRDTWLGLGWVHDVVVAEGDPFTVTDEAGDRRVLVSTVQVFFKYRRGSS